MSTTKNTTEIVLPAHLQAIVDKINAGQSTIIIQDVTPSGYGPEEN